VRFVCNFKRHTAESISLQSFTLSPQFMCYWTSKPKDNHNYVIISNVHVTDTSFSFFMSMIWRQNIS